jgi:hypothetical protein
LGWSSAIGPSNSAQKERDKIIFLYYFPKIFQGILENVLRNEKYSKIPKFQENS